MFIARKFNFIVVYFFIQVIYILMYILQKNGSFIYNKLKYKMSQTFLIKSHFSSNFETLSIFIMHACGRKEIIFLCIIINFLRNFFSLSITIIIRFIIKICNSFNYELIAWMICFEQKEIKRKRKIT